MVKTLVKHGDSWALIIDQPILELLNIKPETPLALRTDGQILIIAAADASEKADFEKALETTNQRYGEALKRLA